MIFVEFFENHTISEDNDGRQPPLGCQSVPRLREGENGVISSAVLAGSTRPITGVIVHVLGESLGGADRPSVRPPYIHIYARTCHAHECISQTQIDATSVTSISIAEIFMAINRQTWPRSVNYVRRSTDYDAAALFARDVSSQDGRLVICSSKN